MMSSNRKTHKSERNLMAAKKIAPLYEKILDADDFGVPTEYLRLYKITNSHVLDIKVDTYSGVLSVHGKKDLRELAKAILAEVGGGVGD